MKILLVIILSISLSLSCEEEEPQADSQSAIVAADEEETADESTEDTNQSVVLAGSLSGVITPKDGAPLESVANAKISVENRPEITGTTDESGNYEVSAVLPGTLTVYVESNDAGASLTSGSSASKYGLKLNDILVKAGETTDIGEQVFLETGSIKGLVDFHQNPNNLDLIGSEVFIPGTSWIAKTDASGSFSLKGIPVGEYSLFLVLALAARDSSS